MASGYYSENDNRAGLILFLLIAAVLAAVAVGALPLTDHATTSHADEPVNASSLAALVSIGMCRDMKVYDCPEEATIKILCKVGKNVVGGLVIGIRADGTQQIITGYAARSSYWESNTSRCREIDGVFTK